MGFKMCSIFFLYDLKLTEITASWKHPHQFQSLNLCFLRSNMDLVIEKSMLCLVTQLCLTVCSPMDCKAPLSMGFSRQEYWSGLPFLTPEDFLDSGLELMSVVSPSLAGRFFYHQYHLGSLIERRLQCNVTILMITFL